MKTEIEAKRVAAELVKASVEGRLKRKRTLDFEKNKLVQDLDKMWTEAKNNFKKCGLMHGTATHAFEYVPHFHEFEATKEDVENALPEQLKEIAKLDGFNLLSSRTRTRLGMPLCSSTSTRSKTWWRRGRRMATGSSVCVRVCVSRVFFI